MDNLHKQHYVCFENEKGRIVWRERERLPKKHLQFTELSEATEAHHEFMSQKSNIK